MCDDIVIKGIEKLEVKSGDTVVFFIKSVAANEQDIKHFEARVKLRLPAGVKTLVLNAEHITDMKVMTP